MEKFFLKKGADHEVEAQTFSSKKVFKLTSQVSVEENGFRPTLSGSELVISALSLIGRAQE